MILIFLVLTALSRHVHDRTSMPVRANSEFYLKGMTLFIHCWLVLTYHLYYSSHSFEESSSQFELRKQYKPSYSFSVIIHIIQH